MSRGYILLLEGPATTPLRPDGRPFRSEDIQDARLRDIGLLGHHDRRQAQLIQAHDLRPVLLRHPATTRRGRRGRFIADWAIGRHRMRNRGVGQGGGEGLPRCTASDYSESQSEAVFDFRPCNPVQLTAYDLPCPLSPTV